MIFFGNDIFINLSKGWSVFQRSWFMLFYLKSAIFLHAWSDCILYTCTSFFFLFFRLLFGRLIFELIIFYFKAIFQERKSTILKNNYKNIQKGRTGERLKGFTYIQSLSELIVMFLYNSCFCAGNEDRKPFIQIKYRVPRTKLKPDFRS